MLGGRGGVALTPTCDGPPCASGVLGSFGVCGDSGTTGKGTGRCGVALETGGGQGRETVVWQDPDTGKVSQGRTEIALGTVAREAEVFDSLNPVFRPQGSGKCLEPGGNQGSGSLGGHVQIERLRVRSQLVPRNGQIRRASGGAAPVCLWRGTGVVDRGRQWDSSGGWEGLSNFPDMGPRV